MLGNQRKRRPPVIKIIRHVLIYDPYHVTTDICLSPQYDWYIVLSKISKSGFQPLSIPENIPMGQEVQRKRKEPTLRRTIYGSLLLCLRLIRANFSLLQAVPKQRPGRPRNQRAAKKTSTVQSPTKQPKFLKERLKLLYT